jgi:enamine deaminase RidA (YjgF/YER057c/UK114 family)
MAFYCQVVRKGPIVATAGMVAFDASGNLVGEGDIVAQTDRPWRI